MVLPVLWRVPRATPVGVWRRLDTGGAPAAERGGVTATAELDAVLAVLAQGPKHPLVMQRT